MQVNMTIHLVYNSGTARSNWRGAHSGVTGWRKRPKHGHTNECQKPNLL